MNKPAQSTAKSSAPDIRGLLAYRLQKATHYVTKPAYLLYSREFGVTGVEWRLMGNLYTDGPLSLARVCHEADVPLAQGSRTLASLTERGLVVRAAAKGDARSVSLSLTKPGRALYRKMFARAQAFNGVLAGALSSDDMAALSRALDVLADAGRALLEAERQAAR